MGQQAERNFKRNFCVLAVLLLVFSAVVHRLGQASDGVEPRLLKEVVPWQLAGWRGTFPGIRSHQSAVEPYAGQGRHLQICERHNLHHRHGHFPGVGGCQRG